MGSPLGAVAGGICLGIATQLSAAYVWTFFSNALALILLLAILLWRPTGLVSAGPARRQDVRDEIPVQHAVVRLDTRTGATLAALGVVCLLGLLPWWLHGSGLMSSVTITLILFLAVLGLDVLMGFAGQVSLGQAGFMAVGGYTASVHWRSATACRRCSARWRPWRFLWPARWCSLSGRCVCVGSILPLRRLPSAF